MAGYYDTLEETEADIRETDHNDDDDEDFNNDGCSKVPSSVNPCHDK